MGRLIDADELKKQIAGMAIKNNYDASKANAICKMIDAQPTAYDPDKVVEKLDKASDHFECDSAPNGTDAYMLFLTEAIEIVKGGGVDA
nr:MAG TPA: hypothetical protein [Caudoviricetes sp.]